MAMELFGVKLSTVYQALLPFVMQ